MVITYRQRMEVIMYGPQWAAVKRILKKLSTEYPTMKPYKREAIQCALDIFEKNSRHYEDMDMIISLEEPEFKKIAESLALFSIPRKSLLEEFAELFVEHSDYLKGKLTGDLPY